MKKSLIALAISGLTVVGNHAFAVEPYIIGQIGESDIDAGKGVFAESLDDTDRYFGLGAGFKVTENLAFEIGYHDFGEAEVPYGAIFSDGFAAGAETLELSSVSVAAVGILPIGPSLNLFGKVGLDLWEAEWRDEYYENLNGNSYGESASLSDDGADIFYAIGAAFYATASTNIFIEYQFHQFELTGAAYETQDGFDDVNYDIDADVLSIGINYGF